MVVEKHLITSGGRTDIAWSFYLKEKVEPFNKHPKEDGELQTGEVFYFESISTILINIILWGMGM